MKLPCLAVTLTVFLPLVISSSTFRLTPHLDCPRRLFWTTTGYSLFVIIPPEVQLMEKAVTFSHFTVHVFINHDPLIASVFLSDLFSGFPDSAWRLRQEYSTPARPERQESQLVRGGQARLSNDDRHQRDQLLQIDPRVGLGRHIFHQPFIASTALSELLPVLEAEFNLDRKLIGAFTIFPQYNLWEGGYPEWHNKPLSWNKTLAEIAMLDHDAVTTGQYSGVADQYAPVLHLVAETKATTLKKNVGGVYGKHFLEHVLGESDPYQKDSWSRFEAFTNCYSWNDGEPEIVRSLRQWRWAFSALQYLESQRDRSVVEQSVGGERFQNLTSEIEEFQKKKAEAQKSIRLLESQWENWVLKHNYGTDGDTYNGEIDGNNIEELVRKVLGQREVVEQWGKYGKKELLQEMLRKAWFDEKLPATSFQAPTVVAEPDISHEESPETGIVQTIPFRRPDGTLSLDHATFTVKSGILSWGQVLPIYFSTIQENLTNNAATIPSRLPGGTIKQHVYTYKSAARVGNWKVRQYHSSWGATDPYDPTGQKHPAGWVFCHADIEPSEILKRVRAVNPGGAISNGNDHIDKDVLYIGRYDWSHHWHNPQDQDFEVKFRDWADKAISSESDETKEPVETANIEARKLLEGRIIQLRNELQQFLFSRNDPIREEDLPAFDDLIFQLEELPHLDATILRRTKIYETLYGIKNVRSIPGNDKFRIKARGEALVEEYLETFRADSTPEEPLSGVKCGGYFIAMDSDGFDKDFVKAYKRDCEKEDDSAHEMVFRKSGNTFGACVSFPYTEYEFGWLVFSGKRHAQHDGDELIAIVYDGTYEVFAGLYHEVEAN